ncbi:MAG TPA: AMP-dependent synthetase/ligase [Frankiaceae bacterium]|nr:AMP-dependent synthetase/ligase [Frankiaceae bacterium]
MRELTVPARRETLQSVTDEANLTDALFLNAQEAGEQVGLRRRTADGWVSVTWNQFVGEVRALAKGLIAKGVSPGERVALMSKTRYEWTLADYAIWCAGAVTVPIYETSSSEQVAWILSDSGSVAMIAETDLHHSIATEVRDQAPELRDIWQIDGGGLEAVAAAGSEIPDSEVETRRSALRGDTLATIIYTSGTTGRPKGCELTHGNFVFDVASTTSGLDRLFEVEGASTLLFLPLAHVFARLIQVGCVAKRVVLGHTADIKNLLPDLAVFQPTFVLAVPRIFEKIFNGAQTKAHSESPIKGRIFDQAEQVAIKYSQALQTGRVPALLKAQHTLFDRLVYSKITALLGGKVTYAVSGGGPLGARLGHFFRGIGITVCEGYGLTESTGGACVNLPHAIRVGSVGRPVPGTTIRIAEDGEVLIRGAHILRGYWHNETATKEAVDEDSFLHTGDIGELDADGYLSITGRKKELIVTAGGKNVAPAVLEDRLRAHALVSQCVVVGDAKPFIACLITLDVDAIPAFLKAHDKPLDTPVADLTEDPEMLAAIQGAVDEANHAVSKAEAIRKFVILPVDFTEEGGELTPSLKLKRTVVMKEFSSEVDALYH